jgi:hypothetical protein
MVVLLDLAAQLRGPLGRRAHSRTSRAAPSSSRARS